MAYKIILDGAYAGACGREYVTFEHLCSAKITYDMIVDILKIAGYPKYSGVRIETTEGKILRQWVAPSED